MSGRCRRMFVVLERVREGGRLPNFRGKLRIAQWALYSPSSLICINANVETATDSSCIML